MTTKISIATGEARTVVVVEQPSEPRHTREIEPQSGYDFEVTGPVRISVGYPENTTVEAVAAGDPLSDEREPHRRALGEPNPGDQTNQRPTPDGKPHEGQTSETSELQPEPAAVTEARERGELPDEEGVETHDDPSVRKPRKR